MTRDERAAEAVRLYASGLSTRDIAPMVGVSSGTVALDLARAGVKTDRNARIAAKAKGRPSSRRGCKLSPEARQRMSEARRGVAVTTGTRRTEEQKQKMRDAANRRWSDPAEVAAARDRELARVAAGGAVRPKVVKPPRQAKERACLSPHERAARDKCRSACKRMLRRILTMARVNKTAKTEALLGYSKEDLRRHLEAQFRPGMSWLDRGSFHIDHITPVAEFFRRGIFDPAVINALSNLQVLTPAENRAKSDKIVEAA